MHSRTVKLAGSRAIRELLIGVHLLSVSRRSDGFDSRRYSLGVNSRPSERRRRLFDLLVKALLQLRSCNQGQTRTFELDPPPGLTLLIPVNM